VLIAAIIAPSVLPLDPLPVFLVCQTTIIKMGLALIHAPHTISKNSLSENVSNVMYNVLNVLGTAKIYVPLARLDTILPKMDIALFSVLPDSTLMEKMEETALIVIYHVKLVQDPQTKNVLLVMKATDSLTQLSANSYALTHTTTKLNLHFVKTVLPIVPLAGIQPHVKLVKPDFNLPSTLQDTTVKNSVM
jgi:hypothetical protein